MMMKTKTKKHLHNLYNSAKYRNIVLPDCCSHVYVLVVLCVLSWYFSSTGSFPTTLFIVKDVNYD